MLYESCFISDLDGRIGQGKSLFNIAGTIVATDHNISCSDESPRSGAKIRPSVYDVDDGTGVIRVSHFGIKRLKEDATGLKTDVMLSRHERQILDDWALLLAQDVWHPQLQIGSTVEIDGLTKTFRGQTEMLAHRMRQVSSLTYEMARVHHVASRNSKPMIQ